jgi:hypothetical protein
VSFEVIQAFRGTADKTTEVSTGQGGPDCGYEFKEGVTYLVYAYSDSSTGNLSTGVCTRTRPLSDAKDDIEYFTKKDDPARKSGIVGDIWMQPRDAQNNVRPIAPAAGFTVVISGVAVRKTVVTRKDGHFEIWGLEPGSYRVSPMFAEGWPKAAQTVKVGAQSCEEVHFLATPPPKKNP